MTVEILSEALAVAVVAFLFGAILTMCIIEP